MWESLLSLCPPQHRQILHLKQQGLSLGEIATRTGLHPGSIRRILYELAGRLALKSGGSGAPNEIVGSAQPYTRQIHSPEAAERSMSASSRAMFTTPVSGGVRTVLQRRRAMVVKLVAHAAGVIG